MGSIAIVDDCAEDAAELARMVRTCRRLLGETVPPCWEVSVFSDAAALSARIDEGYAPDLAFVDVVLNPDTSMADSAPTGIDVVEGLLGLGSGVQVIFMSGYDELHTQVYRTQHAAYLAKPFTEKDVALAMKLALAARERTFEQPLVLCAKGVRYVVRPSEILYLESRLHSLRVHALHDLIETHGKLGDALAQLPRRFVRTHQSFVVNLDAVRSLEADAIMLASGESVPVSRRMRASVRAALFEHIRAERR